MKSSTAATTTAAPAAEADASTRQRVAASVLEAGPSTALALADRLSLTTAAIRRHLDVLVETGQLEAREQRVYGSRGRGRPAKVFALTDTGRAQFYSAYDVLAIHALEFMAEHAGPDAVRDFARTRAVRLGERFVERAGTAETPAQSLTDTLTEQGYVASLRPTAAGDQLCQHHCPVAHVAERFPQLCDVETELFSELLGVHVQRLATIAHGDGVCTTHIPRAAGIRGAQPVGTITGPPALHRDDADGPDADGTGMDHPNLYASSHDPHPEELST